MDQLSNTRRALVLAGGGFAASAWEIGLITGMADGGLDVRNADLFVGTSSGSRVAVLPPSMPGLRWVYSPHQRIRPRRSVQQHPH